MQPVEKTLGLPMADSRETASSEAAVAERPCVKVSQLETIAAVGIPSTKQQAMNVWRGI